MPDRDTDTALSDLVRLLKLAYSGELAAALAYRGHWRSCSSPDETARIQQIEEEELVHRAELGVLLSKLGERPSRWRELKALVIGRTLGALCHVAGWLLPMYGAGRLESRNIREYEAAARHAWHSAHPEWVECLLVMAEVEWEHEHYFRGRVRSHPIGRRLKLWPSPPPKGNIRASFRDEMGLEDRAVSERTASASV